MVPDDTRSDGSAPPPRPQAAAKPHTPPWTECVTSAAGEFHAWLMRPRVRLTLTGVVLLLVGGVIATNSVWTLPLVIVGALMVAVAWIGHRLEGRFAVEWGEAGTQLAFRATIKAPQPTTETPALGPTGGSAAARRIGLARAPDDVIEGEAHTVEINVAELKALIAAAEAAEAAEGAEGAEGAEAAEAARAPDAADAPETGPAPPASQASVRDIRIRRLSDEADRTTRPTA